MPAERTQMREPLYRSFVAIGLLCAAIGCGKKDPALAPVEGRVTIAGEPLPHVAVKFTPLGSTKGIFVQRSEAQALLKTGGLC